MSDTLMTIVAIVLAAILMFIFPLMTMADRADDVAQTAVKASTVEFVNEEANIKGKITKDDLDRYMVNISSTGNTYVVELSVQVPDTNLGKKAVLANSERAGLNANYTIYNTQIQEYLDAHGEYDLPIESLFSVRVTNSNTTIGEQFKNFFYTVTGNDAYRIVVEYTAMATK